MARTAFRRMGATLVLVLTGLGLAGCDIPPSHDELYPPDAAQLSNRFIITHDRYHPWQFQPYGIHDGGH